MRSCVAMPANHLPALLLHDNIIYGNSGLGHTFEPVSMLDSISHVISVDLPLPSVLVP
jgi:hypothetical protein